MFQEDQQFLYSLARNITCSEATSLEQPEMAVSYLPCPWTLVCLPRIQQCTVCSHLKGSPRQDCAYGRARGTLLSP